MSSMIFQISIKLKNSDFKFSNNLIDFELKVSFEVKKCFIDLKKSIFFGEFLGLRHFQID